MLPNIDFTSTQSYKYLTDHYIDIVSKSLKELFESDNQRFEKFSLAI
jgi:glucose-6-phosphate isomerase